MKKLCLHILFFSTFFLACCNMSMAQNNPFHINDKLYSYYLECHRIIRLKSVIAHCDTLFNMSERLHDTKAQCIALYLKCLHYIYDNDAINFESAFSRLNQFALRTPYTEYSFGAWDMLIIYYLRTNQISKAISSIQKYQSQAIKVNSAYAIGQVYVRQGDLYATQHLNLMAVKQYNKAIEYYKSVNMPKPISAIYHSLGSSYYDMKMYDKSIEYYLIYLRQPIEKVNFGLTYLELASTYFLKGNLNEGLQYFNKYRIWHKTYQASSSFRNLYLYANIYYYSLLRNYDRALQYADSLPQMEQNLAKSSLWAAKKDFKQAYNYFDNYFKPYEQRFNNNLRDKEAEYMATLENQRIKNEKEILNLKNSASLVQQMKSKQKILLLDQESSKLELANRRLQLNNKNLLLYNYQTETKKQKAVLARQSIEATNQHEKANALFTIGQKNKHIALLLLLILVIITCSVTIYIILRFRSEMKMKKEMARTDAARKEALLAQQKAEEAEKLKTVFLQNMSHEIRTPLNAIMGFSNLISDPDADLDEELNKRFRKLIKTNSSLLVTLVNDIKDLSAMESGKYKINYQPTDLNELCSLTIDSISGREAANVKLCFEQPADNFILETDPGRTRQLLSNFLTNACKYTQQGSITLTYEHIDDNIVFSVTDTGIGIDTLYADKIFERFEKLGSFVQGSGLGLNICLHISRLLHGQVKLDTSYKNGSRFLFIHPTKRTEN